MNNTNIKNTNSSCITEEQMESLYTSFMELDEKSRTMEFLRVCVQLNRLERIVEKLCEILTRN